MLRTRPPGTADEWTAEHVADPAAAVTIGAEIAWRGHVQRVAVQADPAVRQASTDAPNRRLSRRL